MLHARHGLAIVLSTALATSLLAPVAPTWQSRAQALFAAAEQELAQMPPGLKAQDLSYIANQELLGGVPSAREFQAEFWQARALPNKATAVKEQLEPDAVDGLLLGGAMRQAEELAARADRAQGAILDRLVPAEIVAGRTQQAWSLWTALAPACGERAFVAARALLGTPSTPAQGASLLQEVLAAAGTIGSIAQAESAADFMESALAKYPAKNGLLGRRP